MVQDEFALALAAEVAAILREARKSSGVSYDQLIEDTGIPERTLIRLLKGEAPLPIEKFALICGALPPLDPYAVIRTATNRVRARAAGGRIPADPAPARH